MIASYFLLHKKSENKEKCRLSSIEKKWPNEKTKKHTQSRKLATEDNSSFTQNKMVLFMTISTTANPAL